MVSESHSSVEVTRFINFQKEGEMAMVEAGYAVGGSVSFLGLLARKFPQSDILEQQKCILL